MAPKARLAAIVVSIGGVALGGCAADKETRREDTATSSGTRVTITHQPAPPPSNEQARRLQQAERERQRAAAAAREEKARARKAALEAERLRQQRALEAARAEAAAAQAAQDAGRAREAERALEEREAELAKLRAEQATLSAQLEAQRWEAEQRAAALEAARAERAQAEARARAALEQVANVREEARGLVVSMSAPVLFASNEAVLLPTARQKLDVIALALREAGGQQLQIEGHTDALGPESYNVELSQRRAQAVQDYLVERGVAPEAVAAIGYGEQRPVASNATPEGRANNRRVEIVLPDFGSGEDTGMGGAGDFPVPPDVTDPGLVAPPGEFH